MDKVRLLTVCHVCNGEGFVSINEASSLPGRTRLRLRPCENCLASGMETHWILLREVAKILEACGIEVLEM